jgi:glycosyltransferase involved in cell wall biosynthesis
MAHGVPVITTPLPVAQSLVDAAGSGVFVPFEDAAAAADAVRTLRDDPDLRSRLAEAGLRAARHDLNWQHEIPVFLAALGGG